MAVVGAEPLAVDADRLGAGRPQRVDHELQVAVADLAARVLLGVRRRPGRRRRRSRRWRGSRAARAR